MLIRFIITCGIVFLGYRILKPLIKSLFESSRPIDGTGAKRIDDIMVQDPYCRTYFAKGKGVELKTDQEILLFCSPECRDKYIEQTSSAENNR